MNESIKEKIEGCKIRCICKLPFFGILLLKLPTVEDETVETLATDYRKIYYNPKYLETLTDSEICYALVHECMHVAYAHEKRRKSRKHERWNIACDYAINSIINEYIEETRKSNPNIDKVIKFNKDWLYDKKFINMSSEQIYEQKLDWASLKVKQFDSHEKWDSDNSNYSEMDGVPKYSETEWNISVTAALEKAKSKMHGNLPLGLDRLLKSITRPVINWESLLHSFMQFEVNDYTFSPPDRRNQSDCILPSFSEMDRQVLKNIMFFIDSSGSIYDEILTKFYSTVIGITEYFDYVQGYLGYFDEKVYNVKPFSDINDILANKPKGYGGTNFHAPFEWINDNFNDEIAGIVILTDGECNYPDESITKGVPVLWLYSERQDKEPPFGLWSVIE